MKIGCIGLGHIGYHFAANLQRAGHEVTVHDIDKSRAAETARACEAVITCLPSVPVTTRVVEGENGLVEGFEPGDTWIDMSTNDVHETRRLAALLAEKGVQMLEAPVTGGVHNASSGTITVLVSGDEATFEKFRDIFHVLGGRVFYLGELGKAHVIKVLSNMLAFIHIAASAEAFMLAKRSGIDLRLAWEALTRSSGNSFILETESTTILSGSYDVGFTFDLCLKDMGFAVQLGRETDVPLDIAGTVEQMFIRGAAHYGHDAEYAMVGKLLEEACGTDLRAPGFPETLEEYLATMPRNVVSED
jgi:3-hydroxyisobutyrate dehydrogenase